MARIRKAVFPVGGLGTRFLPATKSMPKEMLPVVDKPLIHYAFEEARAAGIEQFIFVTGRNKDAIENHFDRAYELERTLDDKQKQSALAATSQWLPEPGSIVYLRQQEPLGLGHAVWCARHVVGDEPFAVILADDLVHASEPCLKQMVDAFQTVSDANMAAVMEVPRDKTASYGILRLEDSPASAFPPIPPASAFPPIPPASGGANVVGQAASGGASAVGQVASGRASAVGADASGKTSAAAPAASGETHSAIADAGTGVASKVPPLAGGLGGNRKLVRALGLVEKPQPEVAPSTTSIIGRYILQPAVFEELNQQHRGAGGEIQLTDALASLIGRTDFYGYRFDGTRYDCGEVAGYIEANVALALARPDLQGVVYTKLKALLAG